MRALWLIALAVTTACAVPNLATKATITADTEWSRDWGPEFVADGKVVGPGGHDKRLGWAVRGDTHRHNATLTFTWPEPVTVAELVFYQRTCYGLAGGVHSQDIKRAHRVAQGIRSGQIYVNTYFSKGMVESPSCGWKESGVGEAGMKKYMQQKNIFVDLNEDSQPPM